MTATRRRPPGARPRTVGIGGRWVAFNAVGALGILVQLGALWILADLAGLPVLLATALATEAAVLHNFVWHAVWTWSDRPASPGQQATRLLRFNLTTGLVSIVGNVAVTGALTALAGLPLVAANAAAIAVCSLANFLASELFVFAGGSRPGMTSVP